MLKKIWAVTPWAKAREARRLAKEAQDQRFRQAFWNVFIPWYESAFRGFYCGSKLHWVDLAFQGAFWQVFSEAVRIAKRNSHDARVWYELEDMVWSEALQVAGSIAMLVILEDAINKLKAKEAVAAK